MMAIVLKPAQHRSQIRRIVNSLISRELFLRVEFMSRTLFSARAGRLTLWLGGAALAFLMFFRIT